ncbi:MAG: cysteine-rich CWC family protein [Hylemonella sp.]|nr:cysteine-rich CWC family protein [Hylemonella sp.]
METPQAAIDPRRCPLCGQPNGCANEIARATGQAQPPCWCTTVTFTPELLARVPAQAQRQACICAACAGAVPR